MILDNNLVFGTATALVSSTTSIASGVIDLTGGQTLGIGNASAFGADMGVGPGQAAPQVRVIATTALTTTNSATLNIAFQGNAVASSAADANWITYIETGAIAASALTVSTTIARFDYPIRQVAAAMPRYVRLLYQFATGSFSTGSATAFLTLTGDDWEARYYPSGFTVAA